MEDSVSHVVPVRMEVEIEWMLDDNKDKLSQSHTHTTGDVKDER